MDTGSPILDLILFAIAGLGMILLVSAPFWLGDMASNSQDKFERDAIQQAELARKLAIAEAANAARRRGETP